MNARFGNYEILFELKSGGMGAVLLGRRRGPGTFEQLVAIKTIRPEYAQAAHVRAMFLDEAAILARLNHPGIATVHDFGEDGGTLYMVMEYVAGIALRDVHVPPIVAARAIAEAARGLHAAHEARDPSGHLLGLVHRDISPDNLMFGYDGHVKVIDFGIALVKNRQAPVTEFGTIKGKPPYMSPEQVKNEPMDRRSDVFSLGVVAWELVTGQSLFEGDSIYAIAIAVEQQDIVPPSRVLGITLPAGLDAAIMSALSRDLETRTKTAAELAEALDGVVQASGGESLAAWAERELADKRAEHRAWLAKVVGGGSQLPRARGRASGMQTELAQKVVPPITDALDVPAPGGRVDPIAATSIGPDADRTRRRSLAPFVVVLLALLVTAIAIYLALAGKPGTRARDAGVIAAVPDAAIPKITLEPRDAAVADAEVIVEIPADAPVGHHAPHHRDAGVTVALVPADAAPVGTGSLSVTSTGEVYSSISIDGGIPLSPPVNNVKVSAGRHVIRFIQPNTSKVLDTQTIDIADGQSLKITQR
ncbi:MAG TPA: serine/threonine-protein kinase [Kofleriaceae bacterium]|nr:serine/threonine-protein kinase [Kofleriaceae bacterium]